MPIFELQGVSVKPDANSIPTGFFAYPASPPSIPPTIRAAIDSINKVQHAEITTWEDLRINGRYIIGEICSAIEKSDFFCADVTTINANVMFEIGFAIAKNKRIWLLRDRSFSDPKKDFDQLRMLTTIGYTSYVNSAEIIKAFYRDAPHTTLDQTVFRSSIEPSLGPTDNPATLLYLKSRHDTEASVSVTRVLQDTRLPLTVDDPRETSVQPLGWYTEKLATALGVVAHFLSPVRDGFRLHNARYALVSGLAIGFGKRTLLLTEQSDLMSPLDYRDAMRYYTTPAEAAKELDRWIQSWISEKVPLPHTPRQTYADKLKLATELKGFHLQLGDYVAENESVRLLDYFVETTAYMDVVNGTHTVFVGRKGTGKTSNLLKAADQINSDSNSLVVLMKPVGYEIEGLARLFAGYKIQDHKGYVIESLWKYMLYSEIAHAAVSQINSNALWQMTNESARELVELVERENSPFNGDFTVRLERTVKSIAAVVPNTPTETFRAGISEALHSNSLGLLRARLASVLIDKHQIIILVDNLDKPWTKSADLAYLAQFLLGLLSAAARVAEELRQQAKKKAFARISSAIFMRSDIFDRIVSAAKEPDKLSYTRLSWNDPEMLLRVVEERYTASHGRDSDPATMWRKYFVPHVRNIPTRDYLTSRILPRPRDIVFFVKAAVSFAVNRKHDRVEEKDLLDGEKQYSQYAWDSILVENGITIPELENVLLEFVGSESVITDSFARECIIRAGIEAEKLEAVITHLLKLSFIGLETAEDRFLYADEEKELKKHLILAGRYASETSRVRRYQINAAFRAYLEVREPVGYWESVPRPEKS